MCNDYRLLTDLAAVAEDFAGIRIRIGHPEGIPNVAPRDDIRMTETAPIVRAGATHGEAELVTRRWSWPGPSGKPVYNFRSEGRAFGEHRVLIPADGFYEFTDQVPKAKLKHKWLFTMRDHRVFMIAGITRSVPDLGECFTMLTTEPGPDVAPYHARQVAVLGRDEWAAWLDPAVPTSDVIRPSPKGTLDVTQLR